MRLLPLNVGMESNQEMNLTDIKDLMAQFDSSSLREFSYSHGDEALRFSKNEHAEVVAPVTVASPAPVAVGETSTPLVESAVSEEMVSQEVAAAQGDIVESPLVGVAYLAPAPDKPAFVEVGSQVKKGQTLMIIEAMKVMNEVPAPRDGVITEILVANEDVIEFGQGLVRIK